MLHQRKLLLSWLNDHFLRSLQRSDAFYHTEGHFFKTKMCV